MILRDNSNVLTEKNKTFSVSMEKEIKKVDKDGNEDIMTIFYKIKFIDRARFMASLLSNLVDNFTEGMHIIKFKDCDCFLEYESIKDNLIKCKCPLCNKYYLSNLDGVIKKVKNVIQEHI